MNFTGPRKDKTMGSRPSFSSSGARGRANLQDLPLQIADAHGSTTLTPRQISRLEVKILNQLNELEAEQFARELDALPQIEERPLPALGADPLIASPIVDAKLVIGKSRILAITSLAINVFLVCLLFFQPGSLSYAALSARDSMRLAGEVGLDLGLVHLDIASDRIARLKSASASSRDKALFLEDTITSVGSVVIVAEQTDSRRLATRVIAFTGSAAADLTSIRRDEPQMEVGLDLLEDLLWSARDKSFRILGLKIDPSSAPPSRLVGGSPQKVRAGQTGASSQRPQSHRAGEPNSPSTTASEGQTLEPTGPSGTNDDGCSAGLSLCVTVPTLPALPG